LHYGIDILMNFKITKKPTCLAKIRSPVSKNHAVFAILSSLQSIRSLEPSVQPLHVLPLANISVYYAVLMHRSPSCALYFYFRFSMRHLYVGECIIFRIMYHLWIATLSKKDQNP
jgi:hypothetical protein